MKILFAKWEPLCSGPQSATSAIKEKFRDEIRLDLIRSILKHRIFSLGNDRVIINQHYVIYGKEGLFW